MIKMRRTILAVFVLASIAPSARATTLVRMSLAQLSEASTAIVRGRVMDQQSRWNVHGTRIITLTTIAVEETMKGGPLSTLVIEQPGGTVGNLHVLVPGTVRFRSQAQYVLFLEAGSNGWFLPVGMIQGAYRVSSDRARGGSRVILPLGSLATGHQAAVIPQSPSLGEFHAQVVAAVAAPIVIPPGTAIPVAVEQVEFREVGRFHLTGRTTSDLFPGPGLVIPAGSRVEGAAEKVGSQWKIYWNEISIRGVQVRFSAQSAQPGGTELRGKVVLARVQ